MCEDVTNFGDMYIPKKPECIVLREDCERLAKMVSKREERIEELENKIEGLNVGRQELHKTIDNLREEAKAKDDYIETLKNKIHDLSTTAIGLPRRFVDSVVTGYSAKAQEYWEKYKALCEAGFTSDQAMSFLPMWFDEYDD